MSDEANEAAMPENFQQFAEYSETETPVFPTLEEISALLPQYQFEDVLGVGGMGAVYLARQMGLDRWVAVKLLPKSASNNPQDAARFITEARSMARLTHAHIVAVYEFGQTSQGHLYLVMEHVNGLDLHRLIHRGKVTPERIRLLVPQLCEALQYAHGLGFVHRDIKPANILINENWQAKIVDFGLASTRGTDGSEEVVYGTPDYVAPERLQPGGVADHRADIYSLGVVIHEMFTRRTPQAAGTMAMQGVPKAYADVIRHCLAPDPSQRFQQARDIVAFLTKAHATANTNPGGQSRSTSMSVHAEPAVTRVPKRSGSGHWAWAAGIVLLIMAGWWMMHPKDTETAEAPQEKAAPDQTTGGESKPAVVASSGASTVSSPGAAAGTTVVPNPGDVPAFHVPKGDVAVIKRLHGHQGEPAHVLIHPNQAWAISGGMGSNLLIWDLASGTTVRTIPLPMNFSSVTGLSLTKDGRRLAAASFSSSQVVVFDVASGRQLASVISPQSRLQSCCWSPDDKGIYMWHTEETGGIYYWEPDAQAAPAKLEDWPRAVHSIMFRPNSDEMYVFGDTRTLDPQQANKYIIGPPENGVFSTKTRKLASKMPWFTHEGTRMTAPSADGGLFVHVFAFARIYRLPSMEVVGMFPSPGVGAGFQCAAVAENGKVAMATTSKGLLYGCETTPSNRWFSIETGLRSGNQSLAISKDGTWAVCGGYALDRNNLKPEDHDVLVVRIPDREFWKVGGGGLAPLGLTSVASTGVPPASAEKPQEKLPPGSSPVEKNAPMTSDDSDPELDAIHQQIRSVHSMLDDSTAMAEFKALVSKYAAALRRDATRAAPNEQSLMLAEAVSIESGGMVPEATTDAAAPANLKRLRGIYRTQMAELEKRRQDAGTAAFKSAELLLQTFAKNRRQAGDNSGAARAETMLATLARPSTVKDVVSKSSSARSMLQAPVPVATTVPVPQPKATPAVTTSPPTTTAAKLQRTGKPGQLIKIQRNTGRAKPFYRETHVGDVPPDLGPVLKLACSSYHGLALLPDGSLKSWGTWSNATTKYTVPAEAKDVVEIGTTQNVSAALLADGSVLTWQSDGKSLVMKPPATATVVTFRKGGYNYLYAICSDGSLFIVAPENDNIEVDAIPPAGLADVVDVASWPTSCGSFAMKKNGSIVHWGRESIYIGDEFASVVDALSISAGYSFLAVLHKDGTVEGWGKAINRQRFRVRKYPGASRILEDPAGRIFVVQKPGNEWIVMLNPDSTEENLSAMEGKLKGCTHVAISDSFVFGVKPD